MGAISKAASVFVLYCTSCANNVAMQSKRKTIAGNDVIKAMEEMEFDRFVEPLQNALAAWKNEQKGKKAASEAKKAAKVKEEEDNPDENEENEESKEVEAETVETVDER